MLKLEYDYWKRFWYPKGGKCKLDYAGYLDDPESLYSYITNPEIVSFETITSIPCLILLGEAGSGKSTAIDQVFKQAIKQEKAALKFTLRGYGSSADLREEIFESKEFKNWLASSYQLDLFLDSLDEGLLSLKYLSDTLIREFKKCPCDRLRLRITCRTADWQSTLEKELENLCGKDNVGIYELAPLRQVDVKKAAEDNGLNADAFLSEIQDRDASPLAIHPITLKFLLDIYRTDRKFPYTKKELYEAGIRKLCDENNHFRRDSKHKGNLDTDERMMIAARIAAVIAFSSPVAIYNGSDNQPKNIITTPDLCGIETIKGHEFRVAESDLDEVLSITGLFSSYGNGHNSFEFAHQTYAEFLAAWYLSQHQMTLAQKISLLRHPSDPDKKLVPQLYEVAAWLASLDLGVFQELVVTDPDVMLRSDERVTDPANCATLVDCLLKLYDQGKLLYENRSWLYKRFNPIDLAEKIQPYTIDTSKSIDARYVAIDIAMACQLKSFQDDLVTIALDSSQPYLVRVNAAQTVSKISDTDVKAKLKPLVLGDKADDPNNELKGYGLHAVYPAHITTAEVFDILTKPTGNVFGGTYQDFVARNLVNHIKPEDLPIALKWVESQDSRNDLLYPFSNLSDSIMLLAWEHLEFLNVLELFATIIFKKWSRYKQIIDEQHESLFRSLLLNDDSKRRSLLEVLVRMISTSDEKVPYLLLGDRTQIILQKDFLWMIEQLQVSANEDSQNVWIHLLRMVFRSPESSPEEAKIILGFSQTNKVLSEVFKMWLDEIVIDSPEAENLRNLYLEYLQGFQQDNYQLEPPIAERITNCLAEIESGNLTAWRDLNLEMTLRPNSKFHDHIQRQPNITSLNTWQTSDNSTKLRIIDGAKKFVLNWQRESKGLLELDKADVAGYKALRLLLNEDLGFILNLDAKIWKIWTPVIINTYCISSDSRYVQPHLDLTKLAFENAPDEFLAALIARIDKENKENGNIFITDSIKNFWNKRIEIDLLHKLEDKRLSSESIGKLLEFLISHKFFAANKFAQALIPSPPPSSGEERSRAIAASCALIRCAEDAGWPVIWTAIQQDPEFGKEVIESVSYFARNTGSLEWRLQEEHILELYMWLSKHYPAIKKLEIPKQHDRTFSLQDRIVNPEESAFRWQGSILQHLKERGTLEAYGVLQQIALNFPEMPDKLKQTLLESQIQIRRLTWTPPIPQEVLQVTSDRNIRLVNSGEQLLDVIVESLERLNQELQGETPSAFLLWDQIVSRPKDEHALSDYVKIHLEKDLKQKGIIAKREVEIRRRHGDKSVAAQGQRVDIEVDAFVRQPNREIYDSIKVIVEVKGCWNPQLNSAMETQLVDGYLKCVTQYGIYLIGWFNCKQWDKKDSRKPPKLSPKEAQKKFETQAVNLSKQGLKIKAVILDTSLRSLPDKPLPT